jgi:transcriptional regulator with XRE-family HTH domain
MTEQIFAESLGARILRLREERGLTQLQVAAAVGVRRATLSGWERGTRKISAFHLSKIEQFFKARGGGKRT